MEEQMAELNTKVLTLRSATHGSDQPKADEPTTSKMKVVPARTPDPPLILKASPKTPKSPEAAKKPTIVQVCEPKALRTVQLPPTLSLIRTQDKGIDTMTYLFSHRYD